MTLLFFQSISSITYYPCLGNPFSDATPPMVSSSIPYFSSSKYMVCCLMYRGDLVSKDVNTNVATIPPPLHGHLGTRHPFYMHGDVTSPEVGVHAYAPA